MIRPASLYRLAGTALLAGALLMIALAFTLPARAEEIGQQTEEYCLGCHNNPDVASLVLPSGEEISTYIDREILASSIHSPMGIECEACHTNITTYPHPEVTYQNARELSRSYYLACQKCHSDNYDRTLDSMHAQMAAEGHPEAPVCTDCHGAHDVQAPDQPRARISETCGTCHEQEYAVYRESVHGTALIQAHNQDVPVCTDCHGVHNIQDPRTDQFRIAEPEMCAGCHADAELMSRYGLSAEVYDIYSLSWHGVDVSVYKARWPTIWHNSAICSDCHGVHNIYRTDDPRSLVNPANLLVTCQECHPGVSANWTGAWTGHYRITLDRNPFVFYTDAFYTSFTPLILWGCGIYVALQIIRATVARARRSLR